MGRRRSSGRTQAAGCWHRCPQAQQLRAAEGKVSLRRAATATVCVHTELSFLPSGQSWVPEGPGAGNALRPVARGPKAAWRCDEGFRLPLGKLPL